MRIIVEGDVLNIAMLKNMLDPNKFKITQIMNDNKSIHKDVVVNKSKEDIIELVKDKLPKRMNLNKFQYIESEDIGYFGRVTSLDFISHKNLCNKLNFHEGTLMYDNGWLVFWYHGDVLFISQHPVRYNLSWDDINKHNLVYGKRVVMLGDKNYSVMLPTGGNKDNQGEGSMWNDLIYKVHKEYGIWDQLTDIDLNINWRVCDVGASTWCQEQYDDSVKYRTVCGFGRLRNLCEDISSLSDAYSGVRFVLKLKQDIV